MPDLWIPGCPLADGDVTDDRDPWCWICVNATQKLSGWLWHSLITQCRVTWTDQCCFVSIVDIIIYSRNAVEHIYHLRLVSERLSEAGMKIKPDDRKQMSMTYSSESEDSEHSLAGGVIQYIYYIFSMLVSSLHAVEACIGYIRAEFYSILFCYFIFFYCNLWLLFRAMHSSIGILTVAFKFCFA